jgi:2-oxoglutarate ferredoxin oxidoreductase subunit beta
MSEMPKYKKSDFVSNQEVKWCPGCGDYAILSAVQLAMTKLGRKREEIAFVSGIGCSSRFPYYMNTYGMHTIHGRAPAFASGLKLQNPDLSIWVITGDGDGMSIGGNHLIHAIRRNVNMNIILFNNEIYGLTKGQYSPTSEVGLVTKSTPYGAVDRPFTPGNLALGAGSTFFARTIDTDPKHMQEVFLAAEQHQGTSFIEVFQNCVIFNDKVHEKYTNRQTRDDFTVRLKNNEPMIFGKEVKKGIRMNGVTPEVVNLADEDVSEDSLLVHDETSINIANMLCRMESEEHPVPLGIIRKVEAPYYDKSVTQQIEDVTEKKGKGSMEKLLHSGDTWEVN